MNKKLLIFDLDGVIFDSKKNMEIAWNETSKKFNLKISFSSYFKKIGIPFLDILKSLGVKPNKKISEYYNKSSINNSNLIKPYKNAVRLLQFLNKKKIIFSIVTSKDANRTKYLLKKFDINPNSIHCPNKKLRGKPYPDHLLESIKKNKVKSEEACYFGDMRVDYLSAKNANIDFIFVKYGYGSKKNYKYQISNFRQIKKFI